MKKLLLEIILFLVILVAPWWVSVLFALALLYYFKSFNEIILFGLVIDILYNKFSPGVWDIFNFFGFRFTFFFLILLLISYFVKKRLKFYSK